MIRGEKTRILEFMEYRLFQYGTDDVYIKDVIEEGLKHNDHSSELSEAWFHQRFEQNPLGKAILACAFDNTCLAAYALVERVPFKEDSPLVDGACVSGMYIRPEYRGQVVLSDLLMLAEEEARRQGIELLFALNKPEIDEDASRYGWICGTTKICYRMKPVSVIKSIFKLLDMSKPFVTGLIVKGRAKYLSDGGAVQEVESRLNKDYLRWLISTSPHKCCMVVDGEHVVALVALGHRGKSLQEAQIIYMESKKDGVAPQRYQAEVVEAICKIVSVDVISCLDDYPYLTKKGSTGASPITTYCYKNLSGDCSLQPEDVVKKLVISSVMML